MYIPVYRVNFKICIRNKIFKFKSLCTLHVFTNAFSLLYQCFHFNSFNQNVEFYFVYWMICILNIIQCLDKYWHHSADWLIGWEDILSLNRSDCLSSHMYWFLKIMYHHKIRRNFCLISTHCFLNILYFFISNKTILSDSSDHVSMLLFQSVH